MSGAQFKTPDLLVEALELIHGHLKSGKGFAKKLSDYHGATKLRNELKFFEMLSTFDFSNEFN